MFILSFEKDLLLSLHHYKVKMHGHFIIAWSKMYTSLFALIKILLCSVNVISLCAVLFKSYWKFVELEMKLGFAPVWYLSYSNYHHQISTWCIIKVHDIWMHSSCIPFSRKMRLQMHQGRGYDWPVQPRTHHPLKDFVFCFFSYFFM